MTKFKKFSELICVGLIYPLVLAFVTNVTADGIFFFAGIEVMWLITAGFILYAITAIWSVLYLVIITVNKIIEWREERQRRKEHPDEAAYD